MKQTPFKIVLAVEIQLILILLIVVITRQTTLDNKIRNNNKFIVEVLKDKQKEALSTSNENDIFIGDSNAPVEIMMYTKYNCGACASFYQNTYPKIYNEYIKTGVVKMYFRYLTHTNNAKAFYAVKCARFSFEKGVYKEFNKKLTALSFNDLDSLSIKENVLSLIKDKEEFEQFLADISVDEQIMRDAQFARSNGITSTPTFFVGNAKVVGARRFGKFVELINQEEVECCD